METRWLADQGGWDVVVRGCVTIMEIPSWWDTVTQARGTFVTFQMQVPMRIGNVFPFCSAL